MYPNYLDHSGLVTKVFVIPDVSAFDKTEAKINIGSMVVVNFGNRSLYGVVKWLGQMTGVQGLYAGVELVSGSHGV